MRRARADRAAVVLATAMLLAPAHAPAQDSKTGGRKATDLKATDSRSIDLKSVEKLLGEGRYAEAERDARTAVANAEAEHGGGSFEAANAMDALVKALALGGSSASAETQSLARRAVEIKEGTRGPEGRQTALSLVNLALVLRESGAYAEARPLFERARRILEKPDKAGDPALLACINNLAQLLQSSGELDEARKLFERVLAVRERSLGPEDALVAKSLNNLSMLLMDLDDPRAALPLARRALEVRERKLRPEDPLLASSLNNLGWILHSVGDFAAARPLYERALKIREAVLTPDHPFLASTLENLALVLAETGHPSDTAKALALHERALEMRRRSLGPSHPLVARSLHHIARARIRSGDLAAGVEAALVAEAIGREHLRSMAREMSDREALLYREARDLASARTSGLDLALSAAWKMNDPGAASRTWDSLVRSRAAILDELAARRRGVDSSNPETQQLWREHLEAAERHANVRIRGPGDEPPAAYRQLLDDLRGRMEEAEQALAARSATFRKKQASDRAGLAQAAAELPAGSALVAFARHEIDGGEYVAFVFRAGEKDPCVVPIGAAGEVDALVAAWGEEAAHGALRPLRSKEEAESAYRSAGEALRRTVWDPVASRIGDARRVFIVPDGSLHLVSLAALPASGPNSAKYLVETGPVLQYLSAERDLAETTLRPARGKSLLAVGGPAFDASPAHGEASETSPLEVASVGAFRGAALDVIDLRSIRFEPLPASVEEVQQIASIWKARRADSGDAIVLAGAEATETAFKRLAPGRGVIHLATHGFFLDGRSASTIAGTRGITRLKQKRVEPKAEAQGEPPAAKVHSPLGLSGLAFAGANLRAATVRGEDDGILTTEEISAMDLSSAEWVVLSACDTGAGKIQTGEGVLGLRRAFQTAGAGTLVLSLWPVEDRSAREWMHALYEAHLVEALDAAASAHEASLAVLRARRERGGSTHPFYWAAFVAAGR